MEKPFYEFDLTKDEALSQELNEIYDFSHNTSNYTKLIFRGPEREGFQNTIKFFNSYEELLVEYNDISEKWIPNNIDKSYGQLSLFGESIEWKNYPKIHNFILNKVLELYGEDIILKKIDDSTILIKNIIIHEGLLTMYKKRGILTKHKDGKPTQKVNFTKPANILLYLNKDYKKEWGGCFVVNGIEVVPEFGKLVFLNFRNDSDPEHEVSIIKEDINRIALLFNIMYSEKPTIIRNIQ